MEKNLLLIQKFSGISSLCIIGTGKSRFQPKIYKMSCSSQLFNGICPVCSFTETPSMPWGSRDHLLSNTGQTIAGQRCRAPSNTVQVHSHLQLELFTIFERVKHGVSDGSVTQLSWEEAVERTKCNMVTLEGLKGTLLQLVNQPGSYKKHRTWHMSPLSQSSQGPSILPHLPHFQAAWTELLITCCYKQDKNRDKTALEPMIINRLQRMQSREAASTEHNMHTKTQYRIFGEIPLQWDKIQCTHQKEKKV